MDASLRRQLESGVVAAMDAAAERVMQWGKDDCALWCADILRDVLPYDPARDFRGRYTTRNGSRRVLGPGGLPALAKRLARRHGWERIDPRLAQPGDLGLAWTAVEVPGRPAALVLATVICRASGWFVGRNEKGFTGIRANNVAAAWSILPDTRDTAPGVRFAPCRISTRPELVRSSAVAHEPISTAIGLTALVFGAADAVGIGISVGVAGVIGGAIVSGVLSIGVSLVASMLQPHVGQGPISSSLTDNAGGLANTSAAQSVQVTERQPLPFKRVVVGSAYVGGALFFEQVKPPYLYMGILLSYGRISSIEKTYIGTNQISFAGFVENTILTPIAVNGQPDYPNFLKASYRLGDVNQAIDSLIHADFANMDTEFRQRGNATAVFRYHFGGTDNSAATQAAFTKLWGQVSRPNAYHVLHGAFVYDPRDPTQSLADESTWKWSNNASLVQAWYLTRSWGGRIPTASMVWSKVATSADYDDSAIACADGTFIKRHTVDGVITLNQRPSEVMPKLLTANRGRVLESAGQVWVASSQPKTSIATIHDGLLASGIKYQAAKAKRDLVNKLQVRFVSPDQDYQLADGPILSRTDLQTLDAEVLPATIALDYTQDHRRAQRLQKAFLDSARLGRTITCSVDVRLLSVAKEELIDSVITFNSSLFAKANGTYLITSVGFADDCTTLSLALTEYDSSIETSYNAAVDEQPFTLATLNVA